MIQDRRYRGSGREVLPYVNPEVGGTGPRRARTYDPLIKSQLLYQLS